MKKLSILSMICILLLGFNVVPASAANSEAHIFVDGVPLKSKSVSKNGISFVPFRELFEKLKMNIGYDSKLKLVTGTKDKLKITFTLGSKTAYVNGQQKALQAAPFTQNGTTLIPIRIVGEATGNAVYWSAKANVIQINSPSFKGASYTIDGIPVVFSANGSVLFGPEAMEDTEIRTELAENDAIKEFTSKAPKIRIVGVPPTEEQAKDPGYKGYPDYFDGNYYTAAVNNEKLPPLMSEGWISLSMLAEIENITILGGSDPGTIEIGKYVGALDIIRYKIVLTDAYKKAKEGDFVLSEIHVKKYKGTMYLNIEDLKTIAGLIESN
ncbi:copper amine oxidase N-terminal domain-containing protein [Paenibacillus albidus]|uniref:copper amine oxidase N-terminal domain-containing protein n=1 Tax=Paenibacillus albidus TaxID=2041023 RepID=UPI001BEA8E50|nr:copper amine oxidase N-terminal domain-containing protein [Paenibacillus albidus]MBT2291377.1 copper amine oxidase N-terminal domain-containing protein [Paenibacillus albidus]